MRSTSSRLGSVLSTAVVLLIVGFAAVEDAAPVLFGDEDIYLKVESLGTDTQDTGLLLVDAIKKGARGSMGLEGVTVVSVNGPAKKLLAGPFKKGGLLSQYAGFVVVPGLPPGTYRITKAKLSNGQEWERLDLPGIEDLEVNIVAGKPVYLGQLTIRHPIGTLRREFDLRYDKAREAKCWKLVTTKFSDSPWVEKINEHLRSLE